MNKILIIEDDTTIALVLAKELEKWGYDVAQTEVFTAVLDDFRRWKPQLILLDLSLPYRNGFHWCAEIRKESNVPIIFISSAADKINMVTALYQGADDFIAKPFELAVLTAKVQALLRRSYEFTESAPLFICKGAVLDTGAMYLTCNEKKIDLSRNEFRILQTLMENQDKVVPRHEIMRKLWDDERFIDDNTLTVNINRLRKKLEQAGLPDFIVTKKGEGYLASAEEN